jgi:hypothetical protein
VIKFSVAELEKRVYASQQIVGDIYTEWATELGADRTDVKRLAYHYFYTPDIISLSAAKEQVRMALVREGRIHG